MNYHEYCVNKEDYEDLQVKYKKLLAFSKRVASGCDGNVLEFLCDLEDEAEELLKEIDEL